MGKRKLSKAARFERMVKVWEYLKNNTDKDHPITQAEMRKSFDEFIGDKETFNRLIKDMARAMNSDEHGYKNEEDWKIYFHDFKKYFGDDAEDYDEIFSIIEGILFTKTLDTKSAGRLIEKAEQNLTTNFYKKGPKQICKVMEPVRDRMDTVSPYYIVASGGRHYNPGRK